MFNKAMNSLFWWLIIPSIFYVFASTTFVAPTLKEIIGPDKKTVGYTASFFAITDLSMDSPTWSSSINWIILLSLGTLFAVLAILSFVRYILCSNKFSNSTNRQKFFGVKKKISLGEGFIDYPLWNKDRYQLNKILNDKNQQVSTINNNLNIFKTNSVFAINIVFVICLTISLAGGIVIPLLLENSRLLPNPELLATVTTLEQATNLVSQVDNNAILYGCMAPALLNFFVAFIIIILVSINKFYSVKVSKLEDVSKNNELNLNN